MVGRGTGEFVDAFGNLFNYEGDLSLYSKTPRGGARSTASPTAKGRRATWTGRSMWASGSMG